MKLTLSASLLPYPTVGDAQVRTSDDSLHYCKADGVWTSITGGGGGAPGGGPGAVQYNDGLGGFGGDETKLLWTNSPDRLTISKWDGGFPMPAPIIDSNCILSLATTGNATNFWFAVPAGGSNASFGFSTGGVGFKHAMTYMIGENKLVLTSQGAMGAPSDGLYVDGSDNVSIGYIDPIPSKLYVGGTGIITGEVALLAAVNYRVYSALNDFTLNATHHVVLCVGNINVTLPPVASCPGREYIIKRVGGFAAVIPDNPAEFIDGAAMYTLPTVYSCVTLVCDGTQWHITATYL